MNTFPFTAKAANLFIVIYGAPNLGKTVQSHKLAAALDANYVKYPVYDLEPTGPMINSILRAGVPATPVDLQRLYAQNRKDFEQILKIALEDRTVVGEAYIGTGIAHGMFEGVPQQLLEEINNDLLLPDVSILLDGEARYSSGIERGHRFEDDVNWEGIRDVHRELAKAYGWEVVNANQQEELVHTDILHIVQNASARL